MGNMNHAIKRYGMKMIAIKVSPAAMCHEANQGVEAAALALDSSSSETLTSK